jgi:hypothetical protein
MDATHDMMTVSLAYDGGSTAATTDPAAAPMTGLTTGCNHSDDMDPSMCFCRVNLVHCVRVGHERLRLYSHHVRKSDGDNKGQDSLNPPDAPCEIDPSTFCQSTIATRRTSGTLKCTLCCLGTQGRRQTRPCS